MGVRPGAMEALVISAAFWRNRRVFVTGHTGFKGAWLTMALQRLNARATGFALSPPTDPSLFDLIAGGGLIDDRRGDIADLSALSAAMVSSEPEIVIHMAAQPLVSLGYEDPMETYRVNLMGTVALLEAVRRVPSVRAVVVVTTDKCYDNMEWHWGYRETDRLGGRDPYANSKACAELATGAYRASFLQERGVCVVSARAGNVIGGGDFADNRIVPDAARALIAKEELQVRNPGAVRPWQHVLEPLYGYLLLAEKAMTQQGVEGGYNFGPGREGERNVAELLDSFHRALGRESNWARSAAHYPHEASLLRLDTSRATTELGWSPLLDFEKTLAWTAEWYWAYASGADARRVAFDQVDAYLGQRVRMGAAESMTTADIIKDRPHDRRRAV